METFKEGLDSIHADGGGDTPESLLSSSLHVMKRLDWKFGSTKSLVILTDAGYHSPDLDGTTFYDVQTLSKQIDPVNFYIITTEANVDSYQSLALATDGKVASTADDLGLLTDSIMERFDSLPRVEESQENPGPSPQLTIDTAEWVSSSEYKVSFSTDADKTIVVLNDAVLGITDQREITVSELNPVADNILTLIPIRSDSRGEPISIPLGKPTNTRPTRTETTNIENASADIDHGQPDIVEQPKFVIPKAPNTGKR